MSISSQIRVASAELKVYQKMQGGQNLEGVDDSVQKLDDK